MEMSGLEPSRDRVLEIATIITTGDLDIVALGPDLVIHQPDEVLAAMDAWNTAHHGASGLTEKVRASSVTDAEAEALTMSFIDIHFGAVMHAVRSTIQVHGDSIAQGDVFIANDPHSGGGLHPQDVVIQRPVFVDGRRVAWVALAAHMMDMGGMVPGSSAVAATECYQEAPRLPPCCRRIKAISSAGQAANRRLAAAPANAQSASAFKAIAGCRRSENAEGTAVGRGRAGILVGRVGSFSGRQECAGTAISPLPG